MGQFRGGCHTGLLVVQLTRSVSFLPCSSFFSLLYPLLDLAVADPPAPNPPTFLIFPELMLDDDPSLFSCLLLVKFYLSNLGTWVRSLLCVTPSKDRRSLV